MNGLALPVRQCDRPLIAAIGAVLGATMLGERLGPTFVVGAFVLAAGAYISRP